MTAAQRTAAKRLNAVQIIDPLPKVCPRGKCRAVHGNVLKYRDRGHISATFCRLLTNWLNSPPLKGSKPAPKCIKKKAPSA